MAQKVSGKNNAKQSMVSLKGEKKRLHSKMCASHEMMCRNKSNRTHEVRENVFNAILFFVVVV